MAWSKQRIERKTGVPTGVISDTTPAETVAIDSDSVVDQGIISGQRLGHRCD